MRILHRNLDGNAAGIIRVQAEQADDMYHLFNLIVAEDTVQASTVRNVTRESKTGSVEKSRMRMKLKIRVERVEFDAEQCSLRLTGKNVEEHEHVKMGQYHTLTLELDHPFTIEKACWDAVYLNRLNDAVDSHEKAEIAAVVLHEGLAHVCLITPYMTQTRARIERKMPKKKDMGDKAGKALSSFFRDVLEAVRKYINFDTVKVVLLGSPGFLKDDFHAYMMDYATRNDDQSLLKNKSKWLRVHASSGHKRAIDEILNQPEVAAQMTDLKAAAEVKALQDFYHMMTEDEDRAVYGFDQVAYADENLAIDALLVTDKFFLGGALADNEYSNQFALRKTFVDLSESVKEHGGNVYIFSSMHVSGQQLDNFTGCAAILRFPMPDIGEQLERRKGEK